MIDENRLKQILEAALLAADEPLTVDQFVKLFREDDLDPESIRADIRDQLKILEAEAEGRGYELMRVASGFRYQVRQELSPWISRLWEEKPPRYSRALLETLALIAYRQPVTRGDIEDVRGVSVSQSIMRTLVERGWIRVVGQREVPGHPAMYGTTRAFLDYFNLKSLDQLPPLPEIRELIEPVIVAENEDSEQAGADAAETMLAEEYADAPKSADAAGDEPDESASQPAAAMEDAESRAGVADVGLGELDSPDDQRDESASADAEPAHPTAEVVQLPRAKG